MNVNQYCVSIGIKQAIFSFFFFLLGRWIWVNKMSVCMKVCWGIRFCVFLLRTACQLAGLGWLPGPSIENRTLTLVAVSLLLWRTWGGGPPLAQKNQVQFLQPGKVMLHMTSFSLCKLKDNLWVSRQELIGIILAAFDPRVLLQ